MLKVLNLNGMLTSRILGMAYATGKAGCRRDMSLALPLLQQAAATGHAQSVKMPGMINQGVGMFAKSKRSTRPKHKGVQSVANY